jgi:hypothetical protein
MELLLLAFALAYLAVYRGGVGTYCAITKTEPPWVRNRRERLVNHETVKGRRAVAVESNRTMRGFLGRLWGNLWEDANRLAAERRAEHQAWTLNGGPRPPVWRRIANWWSAALLAGNQQSAPASNDTDTDTESWDVCLHPVERPDGELGSCGRRYSYTVDPDTNRRSTFDCGQHLPLEPVQPPPAVPVPAPTPALPELPATPVAPFLQPDDCPVSPTERHDWQERETTQGARRGCVYCLAGFDAELLSTRPEPGCPWIRPGTRQACGQPLYLDTSWCANHYAIGSLSECQWGSGNPAVPNCPNARLPFQPFCEEHDAEFVSRTTNPNDAPPASAGTTETSASTAASDSLATVTPINRTTNREDSPVSTPTNAATEVATVQTLLVFADSLVANGNVEWAQRMEQVRTAATDSGLANDPRILAVFSRVEELAQGIAAQGTELTAALNAGHVQAAENVSGLGSRAADKTTTYQNQ